MQVERARELGLCFGVRRAVHIVREASQRYGTVQTLGPVAHNRTLLRELQDNGVTSVASVEELSGPVVAVSAHGVAPDVFRRLRERGCTVIDTTCPNVSRAQQIAAGLSDEGFTVVIFGDSRHSEVRGLLGWGGEGARAALDASALATHLPSTAGVRIGVIAQTTQRLEDFTRFVHQVCDAVLAHSGEIRVINTLCDATRRRQSAAAALAATVEAMVVIGGRDSANTRRLAETCAQIVETHLIETADELSEQALHGKSRVGLTAGASTPDTSIEQVELRLRQL
jgi:4-hydroxy-3-methylbut-2-enyl diphosphate reductase